MGTYSYDRRTASRAVVAFNAAAAAEALKAALLSEQGAASSVALPTGKLVLNALVEASRPLDTSSPDNAKDLQERLLDLSRRESGTAQNILKLAASFFQAQADMIAAHLISDSEGLRASADLRSSAEKALRQMVTKYLKETGRLAPKKKLPPFKKVHEAIRQAFLRRGWTASPSLKVPYVTSPSGEMRLWFKPQAIYFSTGNRHNLNGAHTTTYEDLRTMSVNEFERLVERIMQRAHVSE